MWAMKSRVLLRGLFICAVLLLPAEMVLACQCRYRESVLDAYERYDAVLVARIQGLEPYPEAATAQPHPLAGLLQAVAVVEKVYKGNVSAGDEIRLQIGNGANCVMTFEGAIGKQVLFYVPDPKLVRGPLSVYFCERSRLLAFAKEDLLYLDNIEKRRGKTRISGTYGVMTANFERSAKKIRIVGENQTYETLTDEDGVYEIYDLPPGKYRLEPEIPAGWKISDLWLKFVEGISRDESSATSLVFTLPPGKHVSLDIAFDTKKADP